MEKPRYTTAQLITLISVFFFWGFVASSNDILIPVFKKALNLEQWQGQLISVAFYIAYTVGALLYQLISAVTRRDLLNRIGYKNGIALGLLISAAGTLLFIPAANNTSFLMMISGLFIVGLGFSLQQTAANPLTINLGDPSSGSQRLSLAGGINNIGTTIGPVILSLAIFGTVTTGSAQADISNIKTPYLCLGLAFVLVALLFRFSTIPNHLPSEAENPDESGSTDKPLDQYAHKSGQSRIGQQHNAAISYPQLWMGMIAIFLYVGVEVSTGGNLPRFLESEMAMTTDKMAPFISLFWASLMIGRWTSAASVFTRNRTGRAVLGFIMPYLAFALFLFINSVVGHDISSFKYYVLPVLVLIGADLLSRGNPARQLLLFSILGIVCLVIGILSPDPLVSTYAFMSVGLFCSTLWPCIFTLAIAGLGKFTNQGSGFLVMMIMGGGLVSLLQGILAGENLLGIRWSFLVGIGCFAYLAFYAVRVRAILSARGVNLEQASTGGH